MQREGEDKAKKLAFAHKVVCYSEKETGYIRHSGCTATHKKQQALVTHECKAAGGGRACGESGPGTRSAL